MGIDGTEILHVVHCLRPKILTVSVQKFELALLRGPSHYFYLPSFHLTTEAHLASETVCRFTAATSIVQRTKFQSRPQRKTG